MSSERISQLLEDIRLLDAGHFELVQMLREQILAQDAAVREEVKYGGLLFSVAKPFCGIFAYAKHVTIEFGQGATLADPFNMLEGAGKFRRHIKLFSVQDIADKHVADYVALALNAANQR